MTRKLHIPVVAISQQNGTWLLFDNLHTVITTCSIGNIIPCLEEVERYVCSGYHAAGFIGYEAAPAFDPSLDTFPPDSVPLLWFGIFEQPCEVPTLTARNIINHDLSWRPSTTMEEYYYAVDRIKDYIKQGDSYQVNYTYRLHAPFEHDPWDYFQTVICNHPMPYAAWIDAGRYKICSFSPELFFRLDGGQITTQPMKGTFRRGRYTAEDLLLGSRLQANVKERAENIMIVDMMRNDLGRIAGTGSVSVPELCGLRQYRSVIQMVSTIQADVNAPLKTILGALFPCSSVTGAPKIRTSSIIRELESTPRHIYCGTVGWYAPSGRACFNVAIRTMLVDAERRSAEYGTGSGIVWGSDVDREYEECRLKAQIIASSPPEFRLVETLLWTADEGYFLLDRHLDRLMDSAGYFSFSVDRGRLLRTLIEATRSLVSGRCRVRMLVDRNGGISLESSPMPDGATDGEALIELHQASRPVDSTDCFLFHKTTYRSQYEKLRSESPEGDDLLFRNERGEITETTIGNIVVKINGKYYTPPVTGGLLAGVFRGELLAEGKLEEKVITAKDFLNSEGIFRINSVRKWQECRLREVTDLVD